jgi:5S rRNA maturation endonuclease (ribonuclease M5)
MDLKIIKQKLNNKAELIFSKLGMKYEVFGDNIYSTCPVHESSDNPRAFSFSIEKGIWKCWTRDCQHQYRNDIFGLIRGALSTKTGEDVGFGEALKWACNIIDVKNTQKTSNTNNEINHSEDFLSMVSMLKDEYVSKKNTSITMEPNLKCPSPYFLSRGFSAEALTYFGVGDCVNNTSKMYDRAVIPIHDDAGESLVALTGRAIKDYKSPKFLIYPKGFNKSDFFYNYHRAITRVNETNTLFLVEGQGDVWKLYEAGITNVMGLFGKTISKEQEIKLSKMPLTHIVILTDNDQAGRESKIQIQRQLNRSYKLSFPKLFTKDIGEMSVEQIKQKILPQIKGACL